MIFSEFKISKCFDLSNSYFISLSTIAFEDDSFSVIRSCVSIGVSLALSFRFLISLMSLFLASLTVLEQKI